MPEPSPTALTAQALPRLLQLASAASPVGSFAWSEALEFAVADAQVSDEDSARDWIGGLLHHGVLALDVPLLQRMHAQFQAGRSAEALRDSAWLLACRETAELRSGDRHQGQALARVLASLAIPAASPLRGDRRVSYACTFALACQHVGIPALHAAVAYTSAWLENAILAAVKLVPLGQSVGQRLQWTLGEDIETGCARAPAPSLDDIAAGAPGQALCSALHEEQPTRLFRS